MPSHTLHPGRAQIQGDQVQGDLRRGQPGQPIHVPSRFNTTSNSIE